MKYLICTLDDENYVYPIFETVDTYDKAKEICTDVCEDFFVDTDVTELEFNWSNGYDRFFVNQIIPIPVDDEYALVYHHAYNGVDFVLKFTGTFEECEEKRKELMSGFSHTYECNGYEVEENIIDDGYEWHIWSIVEL